MWLHDMSRKKGVSPKLQLKWKGPYLIVSQLSDVVFRVQASPRGKCIVVHSDRLKPYQGVELTKWSWKRPLHNVHDPPTDTQEDHTPMLSNLDEPHEPLNVTNILDPQLSIVDEASQTVEPEHRYPKRKRNKPQYLDQYDTN